jgi:hypothetical protein
VQGLFVTPLQVTAQLLPGGHLVLLEIGEDGPRRRS